MEKKALLHLSANDEKIAQLIERYGKLNWPIYNSQFESLARSIVSQQLSTKAAATIYTRFEQLLELQVEASKVLAIAEDELRGIGLSRQKTAYMLDLARYFAPFDGNAPHLESLDDDAVIAELTSIKGIGKWTVEMFLMFHMRRPDVLPLDDLGIRMGMCRLYSVSPEDRSHRKELTEIAEAWQPYRTIACRYIWRYYGDPDMK